MSSTDELLQRYEAYADSFSHGELPIQPAKGVVILTCLDGRIDPMRIFGLKVGDANVLRNAGGIATDDVLRSLAISQHLLGTTEVMVIQHTGCGLHLFDNDQVASDMEDATGHRPDGHMGFNKEPQDLMSKTLQKIRDCGFLKERDQVRGFFYDVTTGALNEVS